MDLRMFDRAKEFAVKSDKHDVKELISKEADWAKNTNDAQTAWWVGAGGSLCYFLVEIIISNVKFSGYTVFFPSI